MRQIDDRRYRCNEKESVRGYRCTEDCGPRIDDNGNTFDRIPHTGKHIARAIIGDQFGSEIVHWSNSTKPTWNPGYRGR